MHDIMSRHHLIETGIFIMNATKRNTILHTQWSFVMIIQTENISFLLSSFLFQTSRKYNVDDICEYKRTFPGDLLEYS